MLEDMFNFVIGLFILIILAVVFTVYINGYISPIFHSMYYEAPTQGLSYATYSGILGRLADTMKIVFAILIGGTFLYIIFRVFYRKEEEVYEQGYYVE